MGLFILRHDAIMVPDRVRARTPNVTDFVSPTTLSVSSTDGSTEIITINNTGVSNLIMRNGGVTRHGTKYTGTALRGKIIKNIKFYLGTRSGTPTGNMVATMRKVSDDSILATSDGVNAATYLENSLVVFNFPTRPIVPAFDVYFLLEYSGGDVVNYIRSVYHTSSSFIDGVLVSYSGAYSEFAINEVRMEIEFLTFGQGHLNDNDTLMPWKSLSEAGPFVTVDFGAPVFIAGLRIYWLSTGRPASFTIAVSNDNIDYSDEIVTYNQIPDTGYVNYEFGVRQTRYLRVRANGTLALEMAELMTYTQTSDQLLATHGHGAF